MWEGCIDKALIFCEEPMFETATVEHAKQVLEGAPTQANVKNKCPHTLQPTPVIITTNNDLWKWCPKAKTALLARLVLTSTVKSYQPLKAVKKGLNPDLWPLLATTFYQTEDNSIDMPTYDDDQKEEATDNKLIIAANAFDENMLKE